MFFFHCVDIDFDQNGTLPRAPEDHLKRPQDRPGMPQHTSRLPQEAFLVLSEVLKIAKTFIETRFSRSHRFFQFFSLRHFEKCRKLAPLKKRKNLGKNVYFAFQPPPRAAARSAQEACLVLFEAFFSQQTSEILRKNMFLALTSFFLFFFVETL